MKALGLVQILSLAVAAALLASPVLAQDQAPPAQGDPVVAEPGAQHSDILTGIMWEQSPNAQDFARVYPRGARSDEVDGRAVLDCLFDDRGRITCTVISEEPPGLGFGEAALRLSREFRGGPQTSSGIPTAGRRTQIPIGFEIARLPRGCPEGRRFC